MTTRDALLSALSVGIIAAGIHLMVFPGDVAGAVGMGVIGVGWCCVGELLPLLAERWTDCGR